MKKGQLDEINTNTYEIIERIEAGDCILGIYGFRICIDGICYVQCRVGTTSQRLIVHAFRTSNAIVTETNDIINVDRSRIYTSAFRACMLNIDHGIKLIKLGLIRTRSYITIIRVYDTVEYYNTAIPRFEPLVVTNKCHNPIKYVIAARMYMSGMTLDEISKLLLYDFHRDMRLVTE